MKILKTANYKKAQNQTAQDVQKAFQGIGSGFDNAANNKALQYAQLVMDLINQGQSQQQAFDTIMQQKGIGSRMQVFRGNIIEKIKELYNQQNQPTFEKSYDQQYPMPSIPQNRQVPAK